MYKLLALSLSIVFFGIFGCTKQPAISGKVLYSEVSSYNSKIYLIQPRTFDEIAAPFLGKVIDSAEVGDDGTFAFQQLTMLQQPTLLHLAVQENGKRNNYLQNEDPATANYMPIVWQPGDQLVISASAENFQQSFSLENLSEANTALMELRNIKLEAFQHHLANKEWNVEDGSQLLEKEEAALNYKSALMDFAETTNNIFAALVAIRWVSPQQDYERVPEFLFSQCETWSKKDPNHPWVQQLCEKADKSVLPVLVGDHFPDVKLPMVSGDTLALYPQLGKKITIIDLWASWCIPCRKENREVLVPLWEQYHDQGFQIIAYGLESNEEAWKAAIEKDGAYRWLHASHLEGDEASFMKTLRIQTIPANFILDSEGNILAKNLHGEELREWIDNYMKGFK